MSSSAMRMRSYCYVLRAASAAGRVCTMPATLSACAVLVGTAHAETSATIAALLSPNRLGARSTLSFTIRFAGPQTDAPVPVRQSVLRFPAGLTLEVPRLRSCSAARLRARGPAGCPVAAAIGRGRALVEAHVGSQTLAESVSLWAFLGPLHNLQPTVEVLGQGYTPFDERVVFSGTIGTASAPFGETLTLAIPPIPTLTLEPDASIVAFSLVIAPHPQRGAPTVNTLRVPSECPPGGFPFAAEFAYADGSSGNSFATVPCP